MLKSNRQQFATVGNNVIRIKVKLKYLVELNTLFHVFLRTDIFLDCTMFFGRNEEYCTNFAKRRIKSKSAEMKR